MVLNILDVSYDGRNLDNIGNKEKYPIAIQASIFSNASFGEQMIAAELSIKCEIFLNHPKPKIT